MLHASCRVDPFFFFFSSRRRHTRLQGDWSSDVCSSDLPTPSPNGVAGLVLARLWALTDDQEWRRLLDRQLAAFAGAAADLSLYGATLLRAVDWAVNPSTRVEVLGPRGEGAACDMHLLALQVFRPRKVVVRKVADRPAATVCVGTTCSLPVTTPDALRELLT